jgi:trehalose 6-phosphate phosphatase
VIYAFSPEGVACLDAVLTTDSLLAFDIDGTLAPIVDVPGEARLPDEVQHALAKLAQRFDVAVITGRSVDDARRMLSFTPRHLIGNHGAEGLPEGSIRSEAFARAVAGWRETLRSDGGLRAAGVLVEDKTYSISLHFRNAPDAAAANRAIETAIATLDPPPRVITGKAVMNVMPADAPDKGAALRALIDASRCGNVLYVGDDDTDETVFGLHLPSVVTVRVEPKAESAAALFLIDQREVLTLIEHIARAARR